MTPTCWMWAATTPCAPRSAWSLKSLDSVSETRGRMSRAQTGGRDSGMHSEVKGMTWTFLGLVACLALHGRLMGLA